MGYPKRRDEFDTPEDSAAPRPLGPVLVEDEVRPNTASAPSLVPPPRVPPGIAATSLGPEPEPRPRFDPIPVSADAAPRQTPPFITFQSGTLVSIIAVLFMIILVGTLAGIASVP